MSSASRVGELLGSIFTMRLRIVKLPPASVLEGLDLRPFKLKTGETRELPRAIADILTAWGYARAPRVSVRPTKKSRAGRKK